jgi:hypothetical protein
VAITYDPAKNERNIREQRFILDLAADFDFENCDHHSGKFETANSEE